MGAKPALAQAGEGTLGTVCGGLCHFHRRADGAVARVPDLAAALICFNIYHIRVILGAQTHKRCALLCKDFISPSRDSDAAGLGRWPDAGRAA